MPGRLPAMLLVAAVALASHPGCGPAEPAAAPAPDGPVLLDAAPPGATFALAAVADGFVRPTSVSSAPGDDGLWIAEQTGALFRLAGGVRRRVLDLTGEVSLGAER